ncbi:hypothetical protein DD238_002693 [Peronospora effusa]|uniref:DIRP domain-containing protein n=1 Tax=Peronospora effusa TaxID=542832 RepID=A0A3M6VII8_9STRA|nr:hypothetical protein DD238_002693 [Peronospora effusa]
MQSVQVLGPRWSLKELRTFYILLKAHGQEWDKLEEHLPQRSSAMVRALFAMHRGYLSLPEASIEGFCAIMMDHYEMQDKPTMILANKNEAKKTILANQNEANRDTDIKQEEKPAARNKKRRRLDQIMTFQNQKSKIYQKHMVKITITRRKRKSTRPLKLRNGLQDEDETGLAKVYGKTRFYLPWSHWFYSYIDNDFFHHNEFMECLSRMGLETMTVAARPIWSSVRASMGRPRRLSRLFFTQEKDKLETYRVAKRQLDPMQLVRNNKREVGTMNGTWPYRSSPPLQPGMPVVVRVESERRFRFATVAAFCSTKGTCHVSFGGNVLPSDVTECNLDNLMVLAIPPKPGKSEASSVEPKQSATTLLRRENGIVGGAPILVTPEATDSIGARHQDEKIRAILAVKSLLHRKEKIILSLANLNERAAEQQMHALKFSLSTTPTTTSSAAIKDPAWTNSRERRQLQKQHSWLAANLSATNKHLKTALLTLQSFSANYSSEAEMSDTSLAYPSESLKWDNMMPSETLTEGQIRWAMDFLAASQRKSAVVVAESALQVVKDDKKLSSLSSSLTDARLGNLLPETMELVVNCVTLMSILHRHVAASPNVPPVVTQKLVERVLELLKPSHEANMDLYAELHAAADVAQAQMVLQASTSETD